MGGGGEARRERGRSEGRRGDGVRSPWVSW